MKNFLIDTQILIWFLLDNEMKNEVKQIINDPEKIVYVSQISFFEIVIKQSLSRLPRLDKAIDDILGLTQSSGIEILNLKNLHFVQYFNLPVIGDHRDPFDRMIISQSIFENLSLISADSKFKLYSDFIDLVEA